MQEITDDYMRSMLPLAQRYVVCILKKGPVYDAPGSEKIQWEHGRANFQLRAEGKLPVIFRMTDGGNITGIGLFDTDKIEEVREIMERDPGVRAGRFIYELHTCLCFPGSTVPPRS